MQSERFKITLTNHNKCIRLPRRSSVYNVMFECWVDGVFVSARDTAPIAHADLEAAIGAISLPNGQAYAVRGMGFILNES